MKKYDVPDRLSDEEVLIVNSNWKKYLELGANEAREFMLSVDDESFCCIFSRTKASTSSPEEWFEKLYLTEGQSIRFFDRIRKNLKDKRLSPWGE